MINIRKLKPIKTNFPLMIAEKTISKIICENIVKEITLSKKIVSTAARPATIPTEAKD
jgi:hypothetical protein|tara:strand:+ start:646 stop:819 length:174 start_codon:yes stop_codon:yes gene_type:complete